MEDGVIRAFRRRVAEDAPHIREESAVVRVVRDPMSGDPPSRYHGIFTGIEHFESRSGGRIVVSRSALPFSLDFPNDYCCSVDGTLSLRCSCRSAICGSCTMRLDRDAATDVRTFRLGLFGFQTERWGEHRNAATTAPQSSTTRPSPGPPPA